MNDTESVTPSQDYLKGLNHGYEFTKERPELALTLIDKMPDTKKSKGFKDGWKQSTLEKTMEEKPKVLSKVQGREIKDFRNFILIGYCSLSVNDSLATIQ